MSTTEKRVLIVDDERDFTLSLEDLLQSWDYSTRCAHDCVSALSEYKKFNAQVVLVDVRLGQESGLTLLEEIKELNPASTCIMMTGYTDIDTVMSTLKLGATDYLTKPISPPALFETLKRCFEKIRLEEENAALQLQLDQKLKMESLGTMAGGIAHDINNILAIIVGNTELALERIKARHSQGPQIEGNDALQGNLKQVLKASERAADTVSQILAFSRQDEQKHEIIDLVSAVRESIKLTHAILPETIIITQQLSSDCGAVAADPSQIHQIMMNLCRNSAQSMDGNGEIIVKLEPVSADDSLFRLDADTPLTDYVRLSIIDSGEGMDDEVRARIFDPFFTTKDSDAGTGIGLAVVHNIVSNHDARISVDSEKGNGTTFRIDFPNAEGDIKQQEKERATQAGTQQKILFVDDEPDIVEFGKEMLEIMGYQVVAETSSNKALAMFVNAPDEFDLLITDQSMREMSGLELAKKMLAVRPELPIIMCSGYRSEETEEKADELNIKAFCMKPVSMSEFSRVIPQVLSSAIKTRCD